MARTVRLRWISFLLVASALILPCTSHAYGYYPTAVFGSFGLTLGIALDDDGNVYVTDFGEYLRKFDPDGNFLLQWSIGNAAYAVVVDGDHVYVAERSTNRILKFTTDGDPVTAWGSFGHEDGEFDTPIGLAIGPDHSVYVSDLDNHRIQKFTPDGVFIMKWGSLNAEQGVWTDIRGLAVDTDGTVYIAGGNAARISVYTSDGTFIRMWGQGFLGRVTDVDIGPDGNLYIPDEYFHVVWVCTPTGDVIDTFGSYGTDWGQFRIPRSLAVNPGNQIYVAEYLNGRVQRWEPCPSPAITVQPEPQSLPYGSTATFAVTSPNAVGYQWFKDNSELFDGGRISGAQTAALTIAGFQASDQGTYWCTVRNSCNQGDESAHVTLSHSTAPSCFGPPAPPPTGMAAWWAMEDGPGHTIPDVLHPVGNKNHASLTGAAALVAGKVGTAVRCNGVNDGLHVPSTLSPRLAATSSGLSIDAWILPRSGSSPDAYRMILQKGLLKKNQTTSGGITALAPGYAFYLLDGGRMGFQMPNLDFQPVRFEPAMAAMSMDEWHHVAVTVQPQVAGGGKFYLDGVEVGSFTPPSGILGNLADLYIGRFTPQLGPATPDSAFNGDIDEVEIFVTAIDSASVRKIWSAGCTGKRRVQVLVNSTATLRQQSGTTEVCFTIQNLSHIDRNYSWSIAASGPAVGCPSSVPVGFSTASDNVLVPAGESVDLSTIAYVSPSLLTAPFTRCLTLTVTDLGDNGVVTANGTIAYTGERISANALCEPPHIGLVVSSIGVESGAGIARFELWNDGFPDVTVPYSIRTRNPETGAPSTVLRIEGQAPGVPWTGSQFLPAGSWAPVAVNVALDEHEPLLRDEIVLVADLDGDQIYDDELASTHVASGTDTSLALVGVVPSRGSSAVLGLTLRAAPNPFGSVTTLMFRLARETQVEVDVMDVTGRRVRHVTSERLAAGDRRVIWDGRNDTGTRVPAGVYLARVRAGTEEGVVRVLRLR